MTSKSSIKSIAPPKAGKTSLLRSILKGIEINNPKSKISVTSSGLSPISKTKILLFGLLISMPFKGILNVLAAIGVGLVLFLLYRVMMKVLVRNKIRRANQDYPEAKAYVDRVMDFK